MARAFNFSAGPAALPTPVLEQAQADLVDYQGQGMSIMEMSHRGKTYDAVHQSAIANLRRLLNIGDDYDVLFLQGGASCQFAMVPMNLRAPGQVVDYIHTGAWSAKAIKEARIGGPVNVIWDGKDGNYNRVPKPGEYQETPGAAYLHICSNETIGGVVVPEFPASAAPLVADMSSEILSRVIDVNQFGLIYAGAQKNLGPSGLALVIIRRDLLERVPDSVNIFFRYKTHAAESSLYNTPNTWAIYLLKLVTDWLMNLGGVPAMEKINRAKAAKLYATLDASEFWRVHPVPENRSIMNVSWRLPSEELEARFVKEADAAGLKALKGHRSVGGIRASIYNACPPEAVDALVDFMKDFEKRNG
ncbi:3-phosphoserine/phosphohydroxythreonine transaminase [bacterium]|nr:3-phosphoserine/phosphohydroxythreonine transaminase [bacterium]